MCSSDLLTKVTALLTAVHAAEAQAGNEQDTGRDLLFSDPTADLPDVILSESVVYINEGDSFYYTVKLSHQPGVREDATVDLLNDEVRIYLTSSQEVYQQGAATPVAISGTLPAASSAFAATLGHRTQLQINTNTYTCQNDGSVGGYTSAACFVAGFDPVTANGISEQDGSVLSTGICRSFNAATAAWTAQSETTKKSCEDLGYFWYPVEIGRAHV